MPREPVFEPHRGHEGESEHRKTGVVPLTQFIHDGEFMDEVERRRVKTQQQAQRGGYGQGYGGIAPLTLFFCSISSREEQHASDPDHHSGIEHADEVGVDMGDAEVSFGVRAIEPRHPERRAHGRGIGFRSRGLLADLFAGAVRQIFKEREQLSGAYRKDHPPRQSAHGDWGNQAHSRPALLNDAQQEITSQAQAEGECRLWMPGEQQQGSGEEHGIPAPPVLVAQYKFDPGEQGRHPNRHIRQRPVTPDQIVAP